MGTRNLTIVKYMGEVKVAQYGQWDGYPEAQGLTLLVFMDNPSYVEKLKKILPKVRFQNERDVQEIKDFLESIGSKEGWMTLDQAKLFKKRYPFLDRDIGGDILRMIINHKGDAEIVLANAYPFAADSLFCEWAYVIDLDKNTFEVYIGFNREGITPEDRFFDIYKKGSEYYPVKLLTAFPLNELPDDDEFITICRHKCKEIREK